METYSEVPYTKALKKGNKMMCAYEKKFMIYRYPTAISTVSRLQLSTRGISSASSGAPYLSYGIELGSLVTQTTNLTASILFLDIADRLFSALCAYIRLCKHTLQKVPTEDQRSA